MAGFIVSTTKLTKSFGSVLALDDLNLHIPKGISGFIGPNGAGKTTTINILIGLLKPDHGEASIFGLDSWRESYEIRKRIGVLDEKCGYPKNFTGMKFLKHVARIYNITQSEKRARMILNDIGLSEAGNKPIKTYSAGMTQRLGLAQALISDPELAILDEPTANIDPSGRILLLDKIKELHRDRGTNFLISTHILPELEKICDWISIIRKGKLVDQGYVKELAMKYSANVYRIEVSNPQLLAEKIKKTNVVELVWIEDARIYCKVKNLEEFHEEIPRIIASLKLKLRSFQYMHSSLEEIYKEVAHGE